MLNVVDHGLGLDFIVEEERCNFVRDDATSLSDFVTKLLNLARERTNFGSHSSFDNAFNVVQRCPNYQ
ncbi:MAG: hypothetical protein IIA50_02735 [Bacteroidetes bacterium]|nr:hypothetical protein [Bacteroidota bacterium]